MGVLLCLSTLESSVRETHHSTPGHGLLESSLLLFTFFHLSRSVTAQILYSQKADSSIMTSGNGNGSFCSVLGWFFFWPQTISNKIDLEKCEENKSGEKTAAGVPPFLQRPVLHAPVPQGQGLRPVPSSPNTPPLTPLLRSARTTVSSCDHTRDFT